MGNVTNFGSASIAGKRTVYGTLAGTVGGTVQTGLGTVSHAFAQVQAVGTGSAYAAALPAGSTVVITVHAASGSAATAAGTVMWQAVGL